MMNYRERFFLTVLVLCGLAGSSAQATSVTPLYQIRSQGTNAAREMIGWQHLINLCCQDDWYGAGAVALEYSQSFRSNRICECLFGDALINSSPVVDDATTTTCDTDCKKECDTCSIAITGSCVEGRNGERDFLADYFGLPTDFQSTVTFAPKIRNFVADFQFYFGLDAWAEGLYFRLNLPLAYTRWELNACEKIENAGTNPYLIGYFGPTGIPAADLLHSALDFFAGATPDLGTVTFEGLQYSKWSADGCKSRHKTRLADVEAVLGYNFVCNEDYVLGINARATAPAGNRPEGEFLFEPLVGNGKHWELGGGVNSEIVLWRSCSEKTKFSFYLDANVTHLFSARQTRVFDLCSAGNNSRYMLAQKLGANVDSLSSSDTLSDFQFINAFAPVANLTASSVDVSVSVQGDLALKFCLATECGFQWDIGYNFYGRACEKLCRTKDCPRPDAITEWALKGDAHVYGFTQPSAGPSVPVALAATQSQATIHQGTDFPDVACEFTDAPANTIATGDYLLATANPNIDNAQFAFVGFTTELFTTPAGQNTTPTRTSIQPVVLQESDISIVTNRSITHKVFTHFNYTWENDECRSWRPFIGIGASAEFAHKGSCNKDCDDVCNTTCSTPNTTNSNCCDTSCDKTSGNCLDCSSLNQWAVWVKGGIAY